MFGKLKEKLKNWTQKISETKEVVEETKKEKPEKKKEKKTKEKKDKIEKKLEKELKKDKFKEPEKKFNVGTQQYEPDLEKIPKKEEVLEEIKETHEEEAPKFKEKKSFFKKIVSGKKTISPEEFKKYSEDLEMILLENNVALEVSEKIISELEEKIIGKEMNKKEIEDSITLTLKEVISEVLLPPFNLIKEIKEKKEPYVILFCGINGTGKTTHIAKLVNLLKKEKISSVLAAGDTFRAASIEQLNEHAKKLNVKVISHEYKSDPAAVGFDAIKYAKKNKIDAVLIDTAGRIHTATNLIREMQKIKKVCSPDRTIFVGESITGNDATDQVKAFNDNIGIDGIILSKADIDEKGGTALSVGYTTKKPIIYLGTGQNYDDLEPFDKEKFIEKLGL